MSLSKELLSITYPNIQVPNMINFDTLAVRYGHEQALNCVGRLKAADIQSQIGKEL